MVTRANNLLLGRWKQVDPWVSLATKPSEFVEFQANKRLCLTKNKVDNILMHCQTEE